MLPSAPQPHKPKLLDQVRHSIRFKHYSLRTEQVYVDWIRRFILFHGKRHPDQMGAEEIREFLTHLATKGRVAASTQNQAFSALLFLYREVLKQELPWIDHFESDLKRRLAQQKKGAATATSYRGPWKLIYYEAYVEQADALGRERYLKSGSGRRFLRAQLRHYLAKHPLPTA